MRRPCVCFCHKPLCTARGNPNNSILACITLPFARVSTAISFNTSLTTRWTNARLLSGANPSDGACGECAVSFSRQKSVWQLDASFSQPQPSLPVFLAVASQKVAGSPVAQLLAPRLPCLLRPQGTTTGPCQHDRMRQLLGGVLV